MIRSSAFLCVAVLFAQGSLAPDLARVKKLLPALKKRAARAP